MMIPEQQFALEDVGIIKQDAYIEHKQDELPYGRVLKVFRKGDSKQAYRNDNNDQLHFVPLESTPTIAALGQPEVSTERTGGIGGPDNKRILKKNSEND